MDEKISNLQAPLPPLTLPLTHSPPLSSHPLSPSLPPPFTPIPRHPSLTIFQRLLLLLKVDVWSLHSDDGLVQQTERLLHVFGLYLFLTVEPSHGLRETNHALQLPHCDSP